MTTHFFFSSCFKKESKLLWFIFHYYFSLYKNAGLGYSFCYGNFALQWFFAVTTCSERTHFFTLQYCYFLIIHPNSSVCAQILVWSCEEISSEIILKITVFLFFSSSSFISVSAEALLILVCPGIYFTHVNCL